MLPAQYYLGTFQYFILIGSFLGTLIFIICCNRFGKDRTNISIWTNIFVSLCIADSALFFYEDMFHVNFYFPPIFGKYATHAFSYLTILAMFYGLCLFLFTFGYAFYKFYKEGEVTDFMWRLIRLAEEVKGAVQSDDIFRKD